MTIHEYGTGKEVIVLLHPFWDDMWPSDIVVTRMMKILKWNCPKDCERAREKSTRDIFDALSEW